MAREFDLYSQIVVYVSLDSKYEYELHLTAIFRGIEKEKCYRSNRFV